MVFKKELSSTGVYTKLFATKVASKAVWTNKLPIQGLQEAFFAVVYTYRI
jgi:hypothetical protein